MKKLISFIVIAAAVLLFPRAAFAETSPAVVQLAEQVMQVLTPIIVLAVTYLGFKFTQWLSRKTGFDIGVKHQEMVESAVQNGMDYANEQARKYLKKHGEKMRGSEKLEHALAFANNMIEHYKLPAVAGDKLTKLLEAKLGGFTRPVGTQPAVVTPPTEVLIAATSPDSLQGTTGPAPADIPGLTTR